MTVQKAAIVSTSPELARIPERILVDIDGTLYDDFPVYKRLFRQMYGVALRKADAGVWDFFEPFLTREQFDKLAREGLHAPATILGNKPYPEAAQVLSRWLEQGCEIHIVSARMPSTLGATAAWLDRCGIPFNVLVCNFPLDKVAYAREHDCELLIDDSPPTTVAAIAAGFAVATMQTTWTAQVRTIYPDLIVARSWAELGRLIEMRWAAREVQERPGRR